MNKRPKNKLIKNCQFCGVDVSCGKASSKSARESQNNTFEELPFKGKNQSEKPKRQFVLQKKEDDKGRTLFKIGIGTQINSSLEDEHKTQVRNSLRTIFSLKKHRRENANV